MLITGVARAPLEAVEAEVHLGYTNAPGTLWFDDVAAVVTSPVSFSLSRGPEPWVGKQEITLLVLNRQTNQFRGSIAVVMEKQTNCVPVTLASHANGEFKVPLTFNQVGTVRLQSPPA